LFFRRAAPASQRTPEDLAQLWIEAIKANSTAEIRRLIHPGCPQSSVTPEIVARMVGGGLRATYDIESENLALGQNSKEFMKSFRTGC
jgi:hypothetical protein